MQRDKIFSLHSVFIYYGSVTITCNPAAMKKTFRKISIKDSDRQDVLDWKATSPEEKLDIVQSLRENYFIFKHENRKRLQRVYRIVKQKQC
mgnify:CR=1 FL=1